MSIKKTWELPRVQTLMRELSVVTMPGRQMGVQIAIKWRVYDPYGRTCLAYGYSQTSKEATAVSKVAAEQYMIAHEKTGELGGKWLQELLVDEHEDGY